jgi:hypothetical protein
MRLAKHSIANDAAALQTYAAVRLIEISIVADLVCEGVFSFIHCITQRRLMRAALPGSKR